MNPVEIEEDVRSLELLVQRLHLPITGSPITPRLVKRQSNKPQYVVETYITTKDGKM